MQQQEETHAAPRMGGIPAFPEQRWSGIRQAFKKKSGFTACRRVMFGFRFRPHVLLNKETCRYLASCLWYFLNASFFLYHHHDTEVSSFLWKTPYDKWILFDNLRKRLGSPEIRQLSAGRVSMLQERGGQRNVLHLILPVYNSKAAVWFSETVMHQGMMGIFQDVDKYIHVNSPNNLNLLKKWGA